MSSEGMVSPGHRVQEGRSRPSSEHTAPLQYLPLLPGSLAHQSLGVPSAWPPLWIIPTLFPSTASLGCHTAHRAPWTFMAGLEHLWPVEVQPLPPLAPRFMSGADGAPSLGYLSPHFCLTDCICLSIYPTELSSPPQCEQRSGPQVEAHSNLPALGVL